jgi:hypothetical protein
MWSFWRTRNGLSRVKMASSRLLYYVLADIRGSLINSASDILRSTKIHSYVKDVASKLGLVNSPVALDSEVFINSNSQQLATPSSKPIIFASYCADENFQGNLKFCGGTKELNYLVKLLRNRGYEAYMVTYDGSYEPWLLDHQPHISIDEFRRIVSSSSNIRCVTSWAGAEAFIQTSPSLYFWDMELAATEHFHFSVLANLYRHKICSTASISRTIQAWHMAHFQKSCAILPNLLDESLWMPSFSDQKFYCVGYMNEGPHTMSYLAQIKDIIQRHDLNLEFYEIKGVEAEVLEGMQACEVFLSMNIGKDPLWGEGCPRTVIESLASGCVVIAFDVIGNREIIQDNFNSVLVSRYRPDLMAETLVRLYTSPNELDRLRNNSLALIKACHTFESRWDVVKEFLHL